MSWLAKIFGLGGGDIQQAIREGAVIVDVRTAYEFDQGHIPHALNIPVDRIRANIDRLKDYRKPVILCCSTGDHCWEAGEILRTAGIQRVINGGNWQSLWRTVQSSR